MKELTKEKFDDAVNKSIHLKSCRHCGAGGGEIVIMIPWYGRTGARIRCANRDCDAETKLYSIHEVIDDGERFGTVITRASIMRGIKEASDEWNRIYKESL